MVIGGIAQAQGDESLNLTLPTSNDALFRNDGPSFYQYTDRTFRGKRSKPWQGGKFGFVRNPESTSIGIVYTRFHEGIDIKPVYRDTRGEPLDTVRVIDDGRVIYANSNSRHSSYGKFVVVEHWWSGSPFYSLYAHLRDVRVQKGQWVLQGEQLGRMGYTGNGINRRRAHVHFEINMLVNQNFQIWHDEHYSTPNWHGIYNGLNMIGLDVAALYLALRNNPSLTIKEFIDLQQPYYAIVFPNEGVPDLIYRYSWLSSLRHPWMSRYSDRQRVKSWEISFTQSGLPVRIEPSGRDVTTPRVSMVLPATISYSDLTNGIIAGSGTDFRLSDKGNKQIELYSLVQLSQAFNDEEAEAAQTGRAVVRPLQGQQRSGTRSW